MDSDATFDRAVASLREYYGKYARGGHADSVMSLRDIEAIVNERDNQKLLITFMQNPWSQKLLKMASDRYVAACQRQMKPEIRDDLQQKMDIIDKEWATVFIRLLGGDPRKSMEDAYGRIMGDLNKIRPS